VTPYAELSDLTDRFPRELTSDEETRAETLLVDASFWLGVWVPGLAEAIAGGDETAQEAAKLVVVNMVKRRSSPKQRHWRLTLQLSRSQKARDL
jgi:hypothetical protein